MRWSWVLMTHLIGLVSDLLHCRTKAELPARAAAIDDHHSLVADNKAGIGDCGAFRTHALVGAKVDVTPGAASLTISGRVHSAEWVSAAVATKPANGCPSTAAKPLKTRRKMH